MTNTEYQNAKAAICDGIPITDSIYEALKDLNKQYQTHIKSCVKRNDIAQAMYFKQEQFEIQNLIEKAVVQA